MQTATSTAASPEARFGMAEPKYRSKIDTFARENAYKLPSHDPEDLVVELQMVLWTCVKTYDPDNGASFNTYFWQVARNRFVNLIEHAYAQKRQGDIYGVSMERVMVDDGNWHELDPIPLRAAIEARTMAPSAESEFMTELSVLERVESLSPKKIRAIFENVA